ncbi:hypothetical protein Trydic_g23740 [Trypoxylus dichotomus]
MFSFRRGTFVSPIKGFKLTRDAGQSAFPIVKKFSAELHALKYPYDPKALPGGCDARSLLNCMRKAGRLDEQVPASNKF